MEKSPKLMDYLPAVFRHPADDAGEGAAPFIEKFLQLFQEQFDTFESQVDKIPHLFNPWKCQAKFLPWLASWLDLSLPEEWGERTKRSLIYNIFSIYRTRGTHEGLEEYIRIYLGEQVEVILKEFLKPLQVGISSIVGKETVVGKGPPYYFYVHMKLPEPDPHLLKQKRLEIMDIINREKPAHTDYGLTITVPGMQIAVNSTIGKDTLLGGMLQ